MVNSLPESIKAFLKLLSNIITYILHKYDKNPKWKSRHVGVFY